jgi:ribose 5-phosphate isomerase B
MYHIAIGSDHRGYELKQQLKAITTLGTDEVTCEVTWFDVGTDSPERTDYPLYTRKVVDALLNGTVDYGIMICGTGIGASIAANRVKGIYAGLVWNDTIAHLAKTDDNVNLLVFPADFIAVAQAKECIKVWLSSEFKKGRYLERLEMLDRD